MKLHSVNDVIQQMEGLDNELTQSDLSHVRAFNHTYLVITKGVAAKLGTGLFEHEAVMKKVDVTFFEYYFSPLQKYKKGEQIPPAWKLLFAQEKLLFQLIAMALGVNAHVNNDLAQVLLAANVPEEFKADYDKVNDIIGESLREVVESLNENSKLLGAMEKSLLTVYAPFLNIIIRRWRENAWQNFLLLKEGKKEIAEIEKEAEIIARRFLFMS